MPPIRSLLTVAGMTCATLVAGSGCTADAQTQYEVVVQVAVCVDGGRSCYSLGIPNAALTLESSNVVISESTTDSHGVVRVDVPATQGILTFTAKSPLFVDGFARTSMQAGSSGGYTSVTVNGVLSPQVTSR